MAKSQSEAHRWLRRGEDNNAWPGQKNIVFRHCKERSDEAIP